MTMEESLAGLKDGGYLKLKVDRVAMQGLLRFHQRQPVSLPDLHFLLNLIAINPCRWIPYSFHLLPDASAQTAVLQFATCSQPSVAVPTSIHCDHLISAYEGAASDLKVHSDRTSS
jgi:hypothetical protein